MFEEFRYTGRRNDQADCEESKRVERRSFLGWASACVGKTAGEDWKHQQEYSLYQIGGVCVRSVGFMWAYEREKRVGEGKHARKEAAKTGKNAPLMIQGCSTDTAVMA